MRKMVSLIDYTLDEALRRRVPQSAIAGILDTLQKYNVEMHDISLEHMPEYRNILSDASLLERLRCRVAPSISELSKACGMGFKKMAVVWSNKLNPVSLSKLEAALYAVRNAGAEPFLCIEDASRSYYAEFDVYWPIIERYDVQRLIYCDSSSAMDPFIVRRSLMELLETAICPVEFCASNTFGLATANSLAALKAGVEHIGTSVNGVGPKGRTAMEELLMAVRHLWKGQTPPGYTLADDCSSILSAMKMEVRVDKAIIGANVFAHESGIHVDGIAKNPELYEMIKPEEVGLKRQLVIGKHSGTASLKYKFREWEMELEQDDAVQMLEQVRELAEQQKNPLTDLQLMDLYRRRLIFIHE
ncbi:hypothetical protein PDUR_11815 [Paenibacillus durus]|uniref:Uncharacterized protein n=2 Tax=Paenibacillus durus TaxID=44251 RepID=A0A089IU56_PAEDU|nr:hypothetical protein PDUR_11815 [Paenibacillus durus]